MIPVEAFSHISSSPIPTAKCPTFLSCGIQESVRVNREAINKVKEKKTFFKILLAPKKEV
jgi:hypothetical protein